MANFPLSVILGNVGSCSDRYMGGGYSPSVSIEEMFEKVATISGVTGVELVSNWHLRPDNADQIAKLLKAHNLKLVAVIPDNFGTAKWGKGAYTSKDASIRKDAIAETIEMIDITKSLGGNMLSLWPGQDGYDYYFQADYIQERSWFEDALSTFAEYDPNFKISLEYKPKEPRNRSYASNITSTLLMINSLNKNNLGVTIDYGHALIAYENIAESIAIASKYGNKLFHMHMNDAYGYWDDDMICGTIHTIPYLEIFYWLEKTNYQGFISTDQYPYREDGRDAVEESIKWMQAFMAKLDQIDRKEIETVIQSGNAVEGSRMLRKALFGV